MSGTKQIQEAGDNAQQINASQIVINNIIGIDEHKIDEKIKQALQIYSIEANNIATERMKNFADKLIPDLVKENLLEALREPSIQFILLDAQRSAASTERPADYSILSELLIHRIKKGNDRNIIAGVNGAVKIVNEISDDALSGLTVYYSLANFIPVSPEIYDGIKILNNMFSAIIIDNPLPEGNQWLDNLDVLNAVRIPSISSLNKFNTYYPKILSGYTETGINKSSIEYEQAMKIIQDSQLPQDILIDHQLMKNYVRLSIADLADIEYNSELGEFNLSHEQKKAVKKIYSLYNQDKELHAKTIEAFLNLWDSFETLKQIKIWYNSIRQNISVTSIGKALAHANAHRLYTDLPSLESLS